MFVREKISLENHIFNIKYEETEGLNDLDYLVILFANKAINQNKNLDNLFIKFVGYKNDYYLIFKKRFESLFSEKIENYLRVKDNIILFKKALKKYIPKEARIHLEYWKEINKYYDKNNFIDLQSIENDISLKYDQQNFRILKEYKIVIEKENTEKEFEFVLNDDLRNFSVLNLSNFENKIILKILIEKLKRKTYQFLPLVSNYNYFEAISVRNPEILKEIVRSYKNNNKSSEIINLEDELLPYKIELINQEYINIAIFYIYQEIPFVKEVQLTFSEFKKLPIYSLFLKILKKRIKNYLLPILSNYLFCIQKQKRNWQ